MNFNLYCKTLTIVTHTRRHALVIYSETLFKGNSLQIKSNQLNLRAKRSTLLYAYCDPNGRQIFPNFTHKIK